MGDIYQKIRVAIHKDWDPIGVFYLSDELGEYDSYVPGIYKFIKGNVSEEDIFKHLWLIETESIGLEGDIEATRKFAHWLYGLNLSEES